MMMRFRRRDVEKAKSSSREELEETKDWSSETNALPRRALFDEDPDVQRMIDIRE